MFEIENLVKEVFFIDLHHFEQLSAVIHSEPVHGYPIVVVFDDTLEVVQFLHDLMLDAVLFLYVARFLSHGLFLGIGFGVAIFHTDLGVYLKYILLAPQILPAAKYISESR